MIQDRKKKKKNSTRHALAPIEAAQKPLKLEVARRRNNACMHASTLPGYVIPSMCSNSTLSFLIVTRNLREKKLIATTARTKRRKKRRISVLRAYELIYRARLSCIVRYFCCGLHHDGVIRAL